MQDLLEMDHPQAGLNSQANGFLIHGMNLLERGYIFTCMILAALSAHLIDRKFFQAGIWALIGAMLTFVGLMHAYSIKDNVVAFYFVFSDAPEGGLAFHEFKIAIGYLLAAAVFFAFGLYYRRRGDAIVVTGH
jgi:AGZA family xanthine/uracil permease-like MFS transporter